MVDTMISLPTKNVSSNLHLSPWKRVAKKGLLGSIVGAIPTGERKPPKHFDVDG